MLLAAIAIPTATWIGWTERNPDQERVLRLLVQDKLQTHFPAAMRLPDDRIGLLPRSERFGAEEPPDVILVHGLDEPGIIWNEVVEALDQAGFNAWEFRYPNDQAIDSSADLLAEFWPQLGNVDGPTLIGHSMGGLVIRDFVSRWRHPVDIEPAIEGPPVRGVILVATPNQGSELARLRVWLELREAYADLTLSDREFSPLAGLRDGTGAAKIDLRPDSAFLQDLNARPWPDTVPLRQIGGVLTGTTASTGELSALARELGNESLGEQVEAWWEEVGEQVGDGAVSLESLKLDDAPPPLILEATHRGLLHSLPFSEGRPPAIEPIIAWLREWQTHEQEPG
jgi:pimeloyl-ACP methyl ester carboxylesterase